MMQKDELELKKLNTLNIFYYLQISGLADS